MAFKLNISDNGKAWKLESDGESLIGKSLGDKIEGVEIGKELEGYDLEITGGSDIAGFPMYDEAAGIGLKKVLLKKGWGMHDPREGVRLRKTVRGKTISNLIAQINLKVLKIGKKPLIEIFPEQNKPKVKEKKVVKNELTEIAPTLSA